MKTFACSCHAAGRPAVVPECGAQNISIATGGTGGVYYPLGGGVAAVLSKFVPGMQATAEVTGGSVDNLKLVGSGKPYVAFTMTDAAQDAFRGEDKFKGNKVALKTLMILYPNRMHVVSIEGRGVNKMADLKGKRVSTGSPGSATEVMALHHRGRGLRQDKDMKRERRRPNGQRHQGRQDRRLFARWFAHGSDDRQHAGTKIKR
jgi:TRAP transporter TAXI family solute receptor